jgi:hypothetical protein
MESHANPSRISSLWTDGLSAFRVSADLKNEIQGIARGEARSISQVCELLLSEGVQAYKKEGPKFMQRLVAKQKAGVKDS